MTRTRVIFGVDRWSPLQTQDGKQNLEVIGGRLSASPSPAGSKSNSRNSSPLLPKKNIDTSTTRLYSTGACEVGRPRQKWDELESIAAAAAAAKKQKKQSHKQILYLDHTTDNTQIACAVKNGEKDMTTNCYDNCCIHFLCKEAKHFSIVNSCLSHSFGHYLTLCYCH